MAYSATAVADWDSTKPAGTEAVSITDDAIREIKVCIENDMQTSAQVTAAGLAAAVGAVPGLVIRPRFVWKDADEIYIDPFVYYHNGTSEQLLYCDTQLTFQFANLGVSDWSYLYLDDSAIVTAATNLIAAGQLVDSVTEPSWDVADHAWMNGHDRCIFAVRTNGSSQILEFWHDGDVVYHAVGIEDITSQDADATFVDAEAALTIPKFATKAVTFWSSSAQELWYWRPNGATDSTGLCVGSFGSNYNGPTRDVITDGSQLIEIRKLAGGSETISITTYGWYFPVGM